MDNDSRIIETIVYLYTYSSDNHPQSLACRAELQYSGKIEIQKRPALFWNPQSFVDCWMERSIRHNFLIDLRSIQHRLSPDYSLNIYFSRRFPYIDGPSYFLLTNTYEMPIFQRLATCSFFRNCTHILTRTQAKKFEDMFLVKIASKGTLKGTCLRKDPLIILKIFIN